MKTIDEQQLLDLLKTVQHGAFVSLETKTDVTKTMRKTGNPFRDDNVIKESKRQVQFGSSYEKTVNARLDKQGVDGSTFKANKLPFGEWYDGMENEVIIYKDNLYARFYLIPDNRSIDTYYINGTQASKEDTETIKSFLPESRPSATQTAAGLDDKHQLKVIQPAFANIISLTVKGETYYINH
jgi:hypothetical protein